MHPRRRNGYRMSYKNPVAIDPARAHAMKIPGTHEPVHAPSTARKPVS